MDNSALVTALEDDSIFGLKAPSTAAGWTVQQIELYFETDGETLPPDPPELDTLKADSCDQAAEEQGQSMTDVALVNTLEAIAAADGSMEAFEWCAELCFETLKSSDESVVSAAVEQLLRVVYDSLIGPEDTNDAVLFSLIVLLGNSMSAACVRVKAANPQADARGCVLVLGYGGSTLDAIGPYAEVIDPHPLSHLLLSAI